jgi:RNA polymerase sigma-70 factor (ECF subfamily)
MPARATRTEAPLLFRVDQARATKRLVLASRFTQIFRERAIMELATLTERTETSLVLAAQDGDREAFGELARRYARAVYATALRRLGNHAEAQEVCQEVLVRAMQKIGQLREPEAFGAWLKSVTSRMAINRAVRKRAAVATEPETMAATCVEHETPLTKTLARERQLQVRAGLGRLGALDRDTLVAFYVKGQSLVEMSEGFHSPVGTIKRRLHVARKRLAKELEELVAV